MSDTTRRYAWPFPDDPADIPGLIERRRAANDAASARELAKPEAAAAQCMAALAVMRINAIGHGVSDDYLVDAQDCVKATMQMIRDAIGKERG